MVKERESELKHLGGKALNQMYSSCVKKAPAAHHKEAREFDVLSDLKSLSDDADQLAEKRLPEDPGLEQWFEAVKMTMLNIRDCKNVKDIQMPEGILTFINTKDKCENVTLPAAATTPAKDMTPVSKTISSTLKVLTPTVNDVTPGSMPAATNLQVTPATAIRKKVNPFVLMRQLTQQEVKAGSVEKSLTNNMKTLPAVQTPLLNRTFDKMNVTVTLGSGPTKDNNQSTTVSSSNDSGIMTRSGSRRKKENECPGSHGMVTRSGSKRKSSDNKNQSNKKKKMDSNNISSATLNKAAKVRHPLRDLKSSVMASENKNKLSAIIKPPVQQKQSMVSKEQQYLEELKKKEKKREENLQRVIAERQQKAEQQKKTREEKRTKTLQKRIQMEKEKEEKREIEAKKSQVKVNKENPKKITRAKEIVEQQVTESKSSMQLITSTKQSTSNVVEVLVKTPANKKKSDEFESYELTPVPDSSTYNFSDDEDEEKTAKKPIPLWAQGVHLKSALIQQYYHPIDTDELFGRVIETPNLVEIFKINKKRYFKRTSSAIWNSPPDRTYYI